MEVVRGLGIVPKISDIPTTGLLEVLIEDVLHGFQVAVGGEHELRSLDKFKIVASTLKPNAFALPKKRHFAATVLKDGGEIHVALERLSTGDDSIIVFCQQRCQTASHHRFVERLS